MGHWRKTLSPNQRAKLEGQASPWGHNGGSIVVPKRRRTRTARRNEKLRREREAPNTSVATCVGEGFLSLLAHHPDGLAWERTR